MLVYNSKSFLTPLSHTRLPSSPNPGNRFWLRPVFSEGSQHPHSLPSLDIGPGRFVCIGEGLFQSASEHHTADIFINTYLRHKVLYLHIVL